MKCRFHRLLLCTALLLAIASFSRSSLAQSEDKLTVDNLSTNLQGIGNSPNSDQIVFSNFGPGMTFYGGFSYIVSGVNRFGGEVLASRFSVTNQVLFTRAKLVMAKFQGDNVVQIVLMTDSNGVPGTVLEKITLTNVVTPFSARVIVANSVMFPVLESGKSYWLVAFAPEPDTEMGWYPSPFEESDGTNAAANLFHSLDGPWSVITPGGVREVFQIEGSPPITPTILLEEGTAEAAALDSVTHTRGPFPILTSSNFSTDHHTRVIFFTTDLKMNLGDDLSVLSVQAQGIPLKVEAAGPLNAVAQTSYVIVRLPDGLPSGQLALTLTLRGMSSTNSPGIGIAP